MTEKIQGIALSCQPDCNFNKSRCIKNFRRRESPCQILPAKIKTILFEQTHQDFPWVRFQSPTAHTPGRVLVSKEESDVKQGNWQVAGVIEKGFFIPTSG